MVRADGATQHMIALRCVAHSGLIERDPAWVSSSS
jgi:hypothetical protein